MLEGLQQLPLHLDPGRAHDGGATGEGPMISNLKLPIKRNRVHTYVHQSGPFFPENYPRKLPFYSSVKISRKIRFRKEQMKEKSIRNAKCC
jgi:hypothetical protein